MSGDKITVEKLQELAGIVEHTTERYEQATADYERARSVQTSALNDLNRAQKAFDKAIDQLAGAAPRDSDWWNRRELTPPASLERRPGR